MKRQQSVLPSWYSAFSRLKASIDACSIQTPSGIALSFVWFMCCGYDMHCKICSIYYYRLTFMFIKHYYYLALLLFSILLIQYNIYVFFSHFKLGVSWKRFGFCSFNLSRVCTSLFWAKHDAICRQNTLLAISSFCTSFPT